MDLHQVEAEAERMFKEYERLNRAARAAWERGDIELADSLKAQAMWHLEKWSEMSTLDYIIPEHLEAMDDLW